MKVSTTPVQPFQSAHNRAVLTTVLLGAAIVLDLIAVPFDLFEYELLGRIDRGEYFTMAEADANDVRQGLMGLAQVLVFVTTIVVYLMWLHRAHRNLPALGALDLRFTPGWAVGWWFVPVANLFQPYRVVTEVWHASNPAAGANQWRAAKDSPVVVVWWPLFLISGLLANRAGVISLQEEAAAELMTGSAIFAASDGLDAIAAALAIVIVLKIDRWQEEKASGLSGWAP